MFDSVLLQQISEPLIRKGQTIAVAESVTAGFLQLAIASADQAARFFQGGMTAYNLGQKYRHLQVEPIHAESCNCVDEWVAVQMAKQVTQLFCANWGMAITGYATAVPESGNALYAFYAIVFNGEVLETGKLESEPAAALTVQQHYTEVLLEKLRNRLQQPYAF
ncbi:CinA family protein [Chitinophaga lutea]